MRVFSVVILHDLHTFKDFWTLSKGQTPLLSLSVSMASSNTQGTEGSCELPLDVSEGSSSPRDAVSS